VIVVDSSVWIDYFRGLSTPEVDRLDKIILTDVIVAGELIAVEVLQGIKDEREFKLVKEKFESLVLASFGGMQIATQAARNYRTLRSQGVTVRKTIDTIIAAWCIVRGHELLYSDRDFDPFATYLGLRSALPFR